MVEVWRAHGEIDAQLAVSLLESYGIKSSIQGESTRLTHAFTVNELGLVHIFVQEKDAERAAEILNARPEQ